jgi:hypothetical protein
MRRRLLMARWGLLLGIILSVPSPASEILRDVRWGAGADRTMDVYPAQGSARLRSS